MEPVLAYSHKNLLANNTETQIPPYIEIIKIQTSGKAQVEHWHVIQKPLPHFMPSLANISRFQIAYCSLAITMTIGFNIFFILKGLDLKILDGIIVPFLFIYILTIQLTISKCRQNQTPVVEV